MRSVGGVLISLSSAVSPLDGYTTEVCDAWPVRRQTYGYLPRRRASPPLDRYQIILLCDRGTCVCACARACACVCEQLAQGCDLKADRTADIRTRDLFSRKFNAQTATPPGHRGKCPGERVPHSIKDATVVATGADSGGRTDRCGRDGAKDASRNKDCRRL